jgi:large subunit ribosomal protein L20
MRVTNSPASRKRRMRTLKAAKGFRLKRSKLYRYASDALDHGLQYAYRDRKPRSATSAPSGRSASTPPPAPPA